MLEELQNILIQELYELKPVDDNSIDKFFNEVQRIFEWYVKAGTDNISEKWLVVASERNLPQKVAMDLAMELRQLDTVDATRNVANVYRHDHRTGMPRLMFGPMLCIIESVDEHTTQPDHQQPPSTSTTSSLHVETQAQEHQQDLYAEAKGGKEKGGKGYGKCWGCGEWGHLRRECPEFLKPMGKDGDFAGPKGGGKNKGKGKGKQGKGKKGGWNSGKGYGNCNYNSNNYRYPGKGVGKGLDYIYDDYWNAWGDEPSYPQLWFRWRVGHRMAQRRSNGASANEARD